MAWFHLICRGPDTLNKFLYSKARKLVGMLIRQFYNYTDQQTIKTLYLSIVRIHLGYACQVWDVYLEKDKNNSSKVSFLRRNVQVCHPNPPTYYTIV